MTGYELVKNCSNLEEMVELCNEYKTKAGLILYNHRMFSGLRLVDVAQTLGYKTPGIINKWEKGKNQCTSDNLHKLSVILNMEENDVDNYKLYWTYVNKIKYIINNPAVLDKVLEHIDYDRTHFVDSEAMLGQEDDNDNGNDNAPSDVNVVNGEIDDFNDIL